MDRYKRHTDEQLWNLIQEENVDAFTELYHRYWKLLFHVAADKSGNLSDAEDIVQEVFADLWKRKKEIHITHSLKSFLAGATKFQVYKLLARQRKFEETDHSFFNIAEKHSSPDEIYRLKVLRGQLENAIQTLPERCKLVYELSRNEDMSNKQIGETLQISVKTVENQINKAMRRLRTSLKILITYILFFYR